MATLAAAAQGAAPQIRSAVTLTDSELFAPQPIGTPSEVLQQLVELARGMGKDPSEYADLLQQMYVTRAAEKAGIDLTTWDVDGGASTVSDHYEKTYEYYASLYLDDPNFRWAGMAAMIGPSFAAGFEDLDLFQQIADRLGSIPDSALPFPVSQLDEISRMGRIEGSSSAGIYETEEPRTVRIVLPDRTVEVVTLVVDFFSQSDQDFSFGVSTDQLARTRWSPASTTCSVSSGWTMTRLTGSLGSRLGAVRSV